MVIVAVPVLKPAAEGDVASLGVELAVDLQGGVGGERVAVAAAAVVAGVDADVLQGVVAAQDVSLRQGAQVQVVIGVGHVAVRVVVESARLGEGPAPRLRVGEVGAEDDVGQRVRPPFHLEVGPE